MSASHGIRFEDTRFWVLHRRREYGPFDYEWSRDLGGIELHFQGEKFGEYCEPGAIDADLKEHRLPMTVVKVASIVLGCIVKSIVTGAGDNGRREGIMDRLNAMGFARFT